MEVAYMIVSKFENVIIIFRLQYAQSKVNKVGNRVLLTVPVNGRLIYSKYIY
jgi:hypothetical protein